MREHTKLRAFEIADSVVMENYRVTRNFPKEELFEINLTDSSSSYEHSKQYCRRMCSEHRSRLPATYLTERSRLLSKLFGFMFVWRKMVACLRRWQCNCFD